MYINQPQQAASKKNFLTLRKSGLKMKEGIWNQVLTYLYIRKRNPDAPKGVDLKMMHGMNRISLIMFLVGIVVMLFKIFRK